jgi:hypothetical protein
MDIIYDPGPCQRIGCGKDDLVKIRIEGELFKADADRGVEAGYRLYGLHCCGGGNVRTIDKLADALPATVQRKR